MTNEKSIEDKLADMVVEGLRKELYPHPSDDALNMFRDKGFDPILADVVQQHLDSCPACHQRYTQL